MHKQSRIFKIQMIIRLFLLILFQVTINRDQICAGKIIHPILLGLGPDSNIGSKYLQECELMSKLDHPNIAKFLGVCLLPKKSAFPVLLMEKLEKNLDEYLEGSQSQSDSPKKGNTFSDEKI